jgi:hypothetical protein
VRRLAAAAVTTALACGSSTPADVSGQYTVDITDEQNGCAFSDFTEGSSATDIPVEVNQDNASITVTVMGVAGAVLTLGLGNDAFTGTVDGESFNATVVGNKSFGSGGCSYTLNAAITGTITGDAIAGSIDYTSETTSGSACGSITGCETTQDYSGTRPPS